jgi:hypothetical protein
LLRLFLFFVEELGVLPAQTPEVPSTKTDSRTTVDKKMYRRATLKRLGVLKVTFFVVTTVASSGEGW